MTVTINKVKSVTELHKQYSGQSNPQPIFIELDCKSGTLRADYNGEIGNAIPFSVYHGHDQRFYIPLMTSNAINSLMAEIQQLADNLVSGYASVWDGNNHVAQFTDDAKQALKEIEAICEKTESDIEVWNADEWLNGVLTHLNNEYCLDGFGKITAETTDEELSEMAENIKQDAFENCDGPVLLNDTLDYLEQLRQYCIDED